MIVSRWAAIGLMGVYAGLTWWPPTRDLAPPLTALLALAAVFFWLTWDANNGVRP